MKYSRQREMILTLVKKNTDHPDAETVFKIAQLKCPNISLGTVYRNLNVLSEYGYIRKLAMPYVSDRFDCRTDDHCHAVCQSCGKVEDVELEEMTHVMGKKLESKGFNVTSTELVFRGLCTDCQEEEEVG